MWMCKGIEEGDGIRPRQLLWLTTVYCVTQNYW